MDRREERLRGLQGFGGGGGMTEDHMESGHFGELAALEGWYWWHQTRFRWFMRRFSMLNVGSIADVGCGTGGFLDHARRSGVGILHGFEGSASALDVLRERRLVHTIWQQGDGAIASHGMRYDAVVLLDVLEHMDDDVACLREAAELLGTGGFVGISVPADPRLFSEWDRRMNHRRRYTAEMLEGICTAAGFDVLVSARAFRWAWLLGFTRRWLDIHRSGSDFPLVGKFMNRLLLAFSEWECRLLGWLPFGAGTSLFLVAVKRGETDGL